MTKKSARTVAVCNQKGGVGKTTTTINLAACLAERGMRVLTVDLDPQGALTAGFGISNFEYTVYDLLLGRNRNAVLIQTSLKGVDVLPANIDLSAAEVYLVSEVAREQILARELESFSSDYDVILIDCQPSLGLLTINALTASHGLLIPLECEYFAMRGLALLLETVRKIQDRLNTALKVDGIIATMFDMRTLHAREVLESVKKAFPGLLLKTVINRTIKFPDSSIAGMPVTVFAPNHQASKNYRDLTHELVHRGVFTLPS